MIENFKIGDKVRLLQRHDGIPAGEIGTLMQDYSSDPWTHFTYKDGYVFSDRARIGSPVGGHDCYPDVEILELVTTKGEKPMARRTFKQLKDTPDVKKGALWQEDCEDGTQPYSLITPESYKGEHTIGSYGTRALVEEQPSWFVEVFQVQPQYMTKEELDQWESYKKTKKPVKPRLPAKGTR